MEHQLHRERFPSLLHTTDRTLSSLNIPAISEDVVKRRLDPASLPSDVVSCIYCGPEVDDDSTENESLQRGCTMAICTFKRADSVERLMDSLVLHDRKPELLLLVDASPDDETERLVDAYDKLDQLAHRVYYYRVEGRYKTLTCSRNFALSKVTTDLVVFFDDDVEFLSNCLEEMERPHRELGDVVMGTGALIENEPKSIGTLYRIRRLLGIVGSLEPGTYSRSGISIPWNFLSLDCEDLVEGDWLRGCAMMWRTAAARATQFNEAFGGHSNSEDLDFSLRAAAHGKLYVNAKARVLHFPNTSGRPNAFMMGYMGMRNAYHIHRHCLKDRSFLDAVWFFYGWGLDSVIRGLSLVRGGNRFLRWKFLMGRLSFVWQLISGNPKARLDQEQLHVQ